MNIIMRISRVLVASGNCQRKEICSVGEPLPNMMGLPGLPVM